ncbi:MAG: thymidine phosphorylase [Rhodobacteraceae bacterium]|nr:thymidine phosphorylase [Paracoccaceae bacterium]
MDARMILARLRQNQQPSTEELQWFAQGIADQSVSDAQVGAFAMALCMGELDAAGRTALTMAMRDSGDVLSWDLDAPIVDKHSTGGVGDCVSLVLVPALAACGTYVPQISGRGLGHTGGTLDKIESIPGVNTDISGDRLYDLVRKAGCAIVGTSVRIAPADKRLYAIRDVTSTVQSLDLITASILSKKLASGLDALVLDVKVGSGAFMKSVSEARHLARALSATANAAGCKTQALITDMNQPLAASLGNATEVAEVMRAFTGGDGGRLVEIAAQLGGAVLAQAGVVATEAEGRDKVRRAITDGAAAERFGQMVAGMGGPRSFIDNWARLLPVAPVIREVKAGKDGYVTAIDGEALGLAVVAMGGGRMVETDRIDPTVGMTGLIELGTRVDAKSGLAVIHAPSEEIAIVMETRARAAFYIGPKPPPPPPLVYEGGTG